MKQLDLHGIRHSNVQKELDTFFTSADFPVIVITGHSRRMKDLVSQIACQYGLKIRESISNSGRIVIHE